MINIDKQDGKHYGRQTGLILTQSKWPSSALAIILFIMSIHVHSRAAPLDTATEHLIVPTITSDAIDPRSLLNQIIPSAFAIKISPRPHHRKLFFRAFRVYRCQSDASNSSPPNFVPFMTFVVNPIHRSSRIPNPGYAPQ